MESGFTLAGFLVGTVIGLTGIGGGSLMTPITVLIFGVQPTLAIGTNLWFSTVTKMVGSYKVHVVGAVDWQVAGRLWCGSIPACLLSIWYLRNVGASASGERTILFALGLALVLAALALLAKDYLHRVGTTKRLSMPVAFKQYQPLLTVIAGVFIGVFVTLTSVGAGTLCAAMLIYIYPLRMQPSVLVGTDIVHAVPLTLLAGLGHFTLGHTQFDMLAAQLFGSIPGILFGAGVARRLPSQALRVGISAMLCVVAFKFIF